MADNYLERQREAYEARKAAWLKASKYKRKKRAIASTSSCAPTSIAGMNIPQTDTAPNTEKEEVTIATEVTR